MTHKGLRLHQTSLLSQAEAKRTLEKLKQALKLLQEYDTSLVTCIGALVDEQLK